MTILSISPIKFTYFHIHIHGDLWLFYDPKKSLLVSLAIYDMSFFSVILCRYLALDHVLSWWQVGSYAGRLRSASGKNKYSNNNNYHPGGDEWWPHPYILFTFLPPASCVVYRFLDWIEATPAFVAGCFVVRIAEATGFAAFNTAVFTIVAKMFPESTGTVMVSTNVLLWSMHLPQNHHFHYGRDGTTFSTSKGIMEISIGGGLGIGPVIGSGMYSVSAYFVSLSLSLALSLFLFLSLSLSFSFSHFLSLSLSLSLPLIHSLPPSFPPSLSLFPLSHSLYLSLSLTPCLPPSLSFFHFLPSLFPSLFLTLARSHSLSLSCSLSLSLALYLSLSLQISCTWSLE